MKGLLAGKTVGMDSTTLEANAATKSIVRKDTGEDWRTYVVRLMREEGVIEADVEPTDEEVRRYDKGRKNKKVSNDKWQSNTDPDSRIAKMKDGRTHLPYKTEHVVDLENELVLAAEIYPANRGDTDTLVESVTQAKLNVDAANERAGLDGEQIEEVAADKGYHAASTLEQAAARTCGRTSQSRSTHTRRAGRTSPRSSAGSCSTTGVELDVRVRKAGHFNGSAASGPNARSPTPARPGA